MAPFYNYGMILPITRYLYGNRYCANIAKVLHHYLTILCYFSNHTNTVAWANPIQNLFQESSIAKNYNVTNHSTLTMS